MRCILGDALLRKNAKATGKFASDKIDGTLIALDKLSLRAERDVHLVTQSNVGSPMLLGHEDQIFSLEIDLGETVEALFDLLEAQLAQRADPTCSEASACIEVKPHLKLPVSGA